MQMMNYEEKRQFKRLLFFKNEHVAATIGLPVNAAGAVRAHIVNISEDGVGLRLDERFAGVVNAGDVVVFEDVDKDSALAVLTGVEGRVKWAISHKTNKGVLVGLEFRTLAESGKKLLNDYINSRIEEKIEASS
jgi:hypothetical protein